MNKTNFIKMKKLIKSGETHRDVAEQLGYSQATISRCNSCDTFEDYQSYFAPVEKTVEPLPVESASITYKQLLMSSIDLSAEYLLNHVWDAYSLNEVKRIRNDIKILREMEEWE